MNKQLILAGILAFGLPPLTYADPNHSLAFSAGAFEAFDKDGKAAEIGVEYRFSPMESVFNLIPTVGLNINEDGAYWASAGVRYDYALSQNWVLTPNFALVGYEKGAGLDLGLGLEFRSGLDLAYKLTDNSRLALGIYHMSNADLGEDNPGSESVILSYSFDL